MASTDVIYREETWHSDSGERFVRSWCALESPSRKLPKNIVLGLIHGLGDHAGRFDPMARWFASRGVHVYAFDQYGHGRSPGPRVVIPNYDYLLKDVESFLVYLGHMHPDCACGLFGQSMGGNLVLNHQLRDYSKASFAIAGSPMLRAANPPNPITMLLLRSLAKIAPNYVLDSPVDPARLSRDAEVQQAFQDDPLVYRKISLRLGKALIDSGRWALKHSDSLVTPTLLTHGDADVITCHRASMEFVANTGGTATLKLWPEGTHDLHHDTIRDEYLNTVLEWIFAEVERQHQQ